MEIKVTPRAFLKDKALYKYFYRRDPEAHKGQHGRVLVLGGSKIYSGAPALAAMAALRTGADIAAILAPAHVAHAIRSYSPNLIVQEYPRAFFTQEDITLFRQMYSRFGSFVVGSGLGIEQRTYPALLSVAELLARTQKKFVLDADALKLLRPAQLEGSHCVVTPHPKEYEIFAGDRRPEDLGKQLCVLIKGHEDRIYYKRKLGRSHTGNPGMTVGGTGDTLAGILGALLTQTDDLFTATCAATYINGLAGDLAMKKFGYSLLATDVIDHIPEAIKRMKP